MSLVEFLSLLAPGDLVRGISRLAGSVEMGRGQESEGGIEKRRERMGNTPGRDLREFVSQLFPALTASHKSSFT